MNSKNLRLPLLAFLCAGFLACNNEPEPEPQPGQAKIEVSVYSYNPAPGQFINEMPAIPAGSSQKEIVDIVNNEISKGHLVSLGSFGGSIIYHLSSPLHEAPGYDFKITGNAYLSGKSGNKAYGSSEPGIVYVMADANFNGIPDDGEWMELWGQETEDAFMATVKYTQQEDGSVLAEWHKLADNTLHTVVNPRLSTHNHSYFPLWIPGCTAGMEFTGRMLPANGFKGEDGLFHQWLWGGYADSQAPDASDAAFDLANVRDMDGNWIPVTSIDFIKVVSAVLQVNGPLGECSTEVGAIEFLQDAK